MRAAQRSSREVGRVNVVPLIDVVMCLIIFYLMVGQLVIDRHGGVVLPEAALGEEEPRPQELVLTIRDGSGLVIADGAEREIDGLPAMIGAMRDRGERVAVQIRAGRDLPYDAVRPVLRALREAGVDEVRLATERAP